MANEELMCLLEKYKESFIIVEGIKDRRALTVLGFTTIITLSRKPLYAIVEEVAEKTKECLILTDMDQKGKQLYSFLGSHLQKHGVKVNNELRHYLLKKTSLRHIEGLATFVQSF